MPPELAELLYSPSFSINPHPSANAPGNYGEDTGITPWWPDTTTIGEEAGIAPVFPMSQPSSPSGRRVFPPMTVAPCATSTYASRSFHVIPDNNFLMTDQAALNLVSAVQTRPSRAIRRCPSLHRRRPSSSPPRGPEKHRSNDAALRPPQQSGRATCAATLSPGT